jgi:hypothetical protein
VLSDHERHLLADIERRLTDDDPGLARTFRRHRSARLRRLAGPAAVALTSLAVLGASLGAVAVLVLGASAIGAGLGLWLARPA